MRDDRYVKIAAAAYERHADTEERFALATVVEDVTAELMGETYSADLIAEFARQLVQSVDDRKASRLDNGQLDLLTGEAAALDAVWRLGGGNRVRARYANRVDALAWLAIRESNKDRVVAAYDKDKAAIAALLEYMPDDSVRVEQAAADRLRAVIPLT